MTIRVITKTTPNKRQTPVYPWLVDCPQDAESRRSSKAPSGDLAHYLFFGAIANSSLQCQSHS